MAKELSPAAKEQLNLCTVEGNVIVLPTADMGKAVYGELKKSLEGIGGKWKTGKCFVFPRDPAKLFDEILGGKQVNLKKDFQFFETPIKYADMMVQLAEVKKHHLILEPSAGKGRIINAIHKVLPNKFIYAYELMEQNYEHLEDLPFVELLGNDFLTEKYMVQFDRIIANPPFTKGHDIDHIYEMYDRLEKSGRLVSMSSTSVDFVSQSKYVKFRQFLKDTKATIINVPGGEFKESGTMVPTNIIVIDKR